MDEALLAQIPDSLTYEPEAGKTAPIREHPFFKEAKDFPTFAKAAFDAHREVGARVRIPDAKSKPEDVTAFRKTLVERGILPAPIESPDVYGLNKAPDKMPDGLTWNQEAAGKLAGILHKHGVPIAAAAELVTLQQELLLGNKAALKTSMEEGMKALKAMPEFADNFDAHQEDAGRLAAQIFKTEEELKFFEEHGLANHPNFLSVLMRLAPLAKQDSAFMQQSQGSGTGSEAESVRAEVADIMGNKKNARYEGYWRQDPEVMRYVESLYKKIPGADKPVNLTEGISVVGKPS